jgi:hypothetical protein
MTSHFSKHYTLDEARALLPKVRRWLTLLKSAKQLLEEIDGQLAPLIECREDIGGKLVNVAMRTMANSREVAREFTSREIQVKDIERGLIDFPSWREGREVFLCWEADEPDIEHWHDLDSGFAGRERI